MTNVLDELNKYSFFDSRFNFISINYDNNEIKYKKKPIKITNKIKSLYFDISETDKDRLFWFFYIFLNSYDEYKILKSKYKTEIEIKYNQIEIVKKNQGLLKANKFKSNVIINELGNSDISIYTLKGLCLIHNINLCIIKGKMCEINKNNDSNIFYCIKEKNMLKENIEYDILINKYIQVTSLDKPLKTISSYKLIELQNIADKINISILKNDTKKKTKQTLYEEIMNKLQEE